MTQSELLDHVVDLVNSLESRVKLQDARIRSLEEGAVFMGRMDIIETQIENVVARLDGHDLGFATMALDAEGREALARLLETSRS